MHKKTIALVNRYVPINNKLVSGNVLMRATPIRKTAVGELTETMGGLLISNKGNIIKGSAVPYKVERKRPIKFII